MTGCTPYRPSEGLPVIPAASEAEPQPPRGHLPTTADTGRAIA